MTHNIRKSSKIFDMKDLYIPDGPWEFNSSVSQVFTDMISRSIPAYSELRSTISRLIKSQEQKERVILDIGCSNGIELQELYSVCPEDTHFVGYDNADSFLEESRLKFSSQPRIKIEYLDLEEEFKLPKSSSILCIFTLQFVSVSKRKRILNEFYESLSSGGTLFLAEKIKGDLPVSDKLLIDTYHQYKKQMGYSIEQIKAKQKSLENVLVPLTSIENQALLREAGFDSVDVVWASLNFVLYVAFKQKETN